MGSAYPCGSPWYAQETVEYLIPNSTPVGGQDLTEEPRSFARLYITERQLEILSWVQHGKSARDIGDILGISHRTVEHQLEKVCENLGVKTRFQAVLKVRDPWRFDRPTLTDGSHPALR